MFILDMNNESEMMSLYEYLGHAAGGTLGKEVYEQALRLRVPKSSHNISTPKYSGSVMKYPKVFLDFYFNKK